ncbi:MAG TPA: T9SS type A sorting domain-containing protein, partial [Candidatus Marinimicrobia bacterium]|nr:T9SS type A sorting domain-containing protein [Candidatus Neomarinimicrobiota bacterium]
GDCNGDWDYTDQCGECDDNDLTDCYDLDLSLHVGANLVSFPALPTDVSVENIFAGADGVIGEGVGAVNLDGTWIGSLTEVSQDDGYWVKVSEDTNLSHADADPVNYDADGEVSYDVHSGSNLISYPLTSSQSIADALGDAAFNVYAIASEGVAALNNGNDGWVGSLVAFEGGKGYWLVAHSDFSFSFNCGSCTDTNSDDDGIARVAVEQPVLRAVPEVYSYRQSAQQAFFFVDNATIRGEPLESEDIVIAYNGDVVVGSRYWNGELTDIPAIGVDTDGEQMYAGYCKAGDKVTFKVLDASTGSLVDMDVEGDVMWNDMGISVINLTDVFLPTEVSLSNAYPNPFNPVTMLTYDIPSDMNVSMGIYDVRGRLVEELINDMREQGRYEITWNADRHSSGVYMIKMTAGTAVKVQKIMLVK